MDTTDVRFVGSSLVQERDVAGLDEQMLQIAPACVSASNSSPPSPAQSVTSLASAISSVSSDASIKVDAVLSSSDQQAADVEKSTGAKADEPVALDKISELIISTREVRPSPLPTPQPQPPSPSGARLRYHKYLKHDGGLWFIELSAWLLSLAITVAIAIVLITCNGKPPPSMRWGITLNALISIMATFVVVLIMVPVTACLGQLKWLRLQQQPRQLYEYHALDEASKGVWGSLKLIAKGRGGFLAIIGATLTVAILAVGPFLQQLVYFRTVSRPAEMDQLATLPISDFNTYDENGIVDVRPTFDEAVYSGIFSTQSPSSFQVSPHCTTGNCTYPEYQTLAFCSSCYDASPTVFRASSADHDSYIRDSYIPKGAGLFNATRENTPVFNASISSSAENGLQITFSAIARRCYVSNTENAFFGQENPVYYETIATQCNLDLCLQYFTANVTNTKLTENIVKASSIALIGVQGGISVDLFDELLVVLKKALTTPIFVDTSIYEAVPAIDQPVDTSNGTFTELTCGTTKDDPTISFDIANILLNNIESPVFNITNVMDNIAASITYVMRTSIDSTNMANGTAYSNRTIVCVSWRWLTLPVLLEALVLLLLFAVMEKTDENKMFRWRDSSLAGLFHGLTDRTRFTTVKEPWMMEEASQDVTVRLIDDEFGVRLMEVDDPVQPETSQHIWHLIQDTSKHIWHFIRGIPKLLYTLWLNETNDEKIDKSKATQARAMST